MKKLSNEKCWYFIAIFGLFFINDGCFSMEQSMKEWLALNLQQSLGENKQWHAFVYTQVRMIDESSAWQDILIEGGLGHQLKKDDSIWFGYRFTGVNPYDHFYRENRLFQQIISEKKDHSYRFIWRTRLEEMTRNNEKQLALRLRERFAIEIPVDHYKITPYLYEELFFQLNHTIYQPKSFLGENRVFLGFNLRLTEKTWWEIGYINQFQVKTPQQSENQMSHILSCTYNIT